MVHQNARLDYKRGRELIFHHQQLLTTLEWAAAQFMRAGIKAPDRWSIYEEEPALLWEIYKNDEYLTLASVTVLRSNDVEFACGTSHLTVQAGSLQSLMDVAVSLLPRRIAADVF